MNDIESNRVHNYEPIENSIVHNKLEMVNLEKSIIAETKKIQSKISDKLNIKK